MSIDRCGCWKTREGKQRILHLLLRRKEEPAVRFRGRGKLDTWAEDSGSIVGQNNSDQMLTTDKMNGNVIRRTGEETGPALGQSLLGRKGGGNGGR